MDETQKELEMLNPQTEEILVGTRKLRKIKIYPLSAGDQLQVIGMVNQIGGEFGTLSNKSNLGVFGFLGEVVSRNLGKILEFVTDDGATLVNELTNEQIVQMAEIIYKVNFAILEKKILGISQAILQNFQSQRSLPVSSETTPNTESRISFENITKMEE